MELPEYLEFIAIKLRTSNKEEVIRLMILLRDVLDETLVKLEK